MNSREIDRDEAEQVSREAFGAHGIDVDDSAVTAGMLATAEARGKSSYGLIRLPRYVRGIEHGNLDPAEANLVAVVLQHRKHCLAH